MGKFINHRLVVWWWFGGGLVVVGGGLVVWWFGGLVFINDYFPYIGKRW